ncbi:trigger factor [Aureispira sp. CCB-E]|uniref:trigger factor n=1 Tax=Aureispira sp. CCB-E TaxID=3051121 RepID=UPI00286894BC|nr:trigger factor [Aureispira sp. CCB-E]WMX13286.1 trigger factor [Aureispira sp. CCB-E]
MPTITHENVDELNAIVTIELSQDDYLPKVNSKLKEYRQKAQIKGFRPGKVPMGMIKRKFGTTVLVEEVNEAIGENLNQYFKDNNLRVLGQPLAIEDKNLKLSIHKPSDYTFKFELGLAPEFEIKGLSTDNQLPFYDLSVSEEELEAEIDNVRKKYSKGFQEGINDVQEDDMLAISLEELNENGDIKEGGVVKEETFLALRDIANEELKDNLLSATLSDSFDIDVFTIEDKDETYIRKHVLGIEEDQEINKMFRLTIKEIKRVDKAELNEEFFKQLFPNEEIDSEEAFREKVKSEIYKGYKQSSLNHFSNLVFDFLLEENKLDLPVEFLKKWLKETNEGITDEFFEGKEFEAFIKNTNWSLLRDKLAEKYKVEVNYQDVEDATRGEILRYFNYQIPPYGEMMDNMLQKILSDRKEVNRRFEAIMDERILEKTSEDMGKEMKDVSREEFEEILKDYQASKNPAPVEENTETEVEA